MPDPLLHAAELAPTGTLRTGAADIAFRDLGLEVAAGIRQPLTRHVTADPGLRLLEPRFMQIRQVVATGRDQSPETVCFLQELVEELKSSGQIAESLARSGQDATVAPLRRT